MRENSACTQKHFFQSAIPVKLHTNIEQHLQYIDLGKNSVPLHTLQSLGISTIQGKKKNNHPPKHFQKKDWPWGRRLAIYVLLCHSLAPSTAQKLHHFPG